MAKAIYRIKYFLAVSEDYSIIITAGRMLACRHEAKASHPDLQGGRQKGKETSGLTCCLR